MVSNGKSMHIPFESTARSLNRRAGLYLSDAQQRGLAAGLFVGTIAAFAALSWSVGMAVKRSMK